MNIKKEPRTTMTTRNILTLLWWKYFKKEAFTKFSIFTAAGISPVNALTWAAPKRRPLTTNYNDFWDVRKAVAKRVCEMVANNEGTQVECLNIIRKNLNGMNHIDIQDYVLNEILHKQKINNGFN